MQLSCLKARTDLFCTIFVLAARRAVAGILEASQPLQPLDMAALEQTWPTGEEMEEDESAGARNKRVRVPKNVGDYERAWLESETEGSSNASVTEEGVTSDADMQTEEITVGKSTSIFLIFLSRRRWLPCVLLAQLFCNCLCALCSDSITGRSFTRVF